MHVLLLSSWSSGSTFVSKLLSHYPGAFLSFEPLVMLSSKGTQHTNMECIDKHVRIVSFSKLFFCSLHIFLVVGAIEPAQANDTLQLLEDVFKCNYSEPHSWGRKLLWFLRRSNYKQWVLHNDDLRAACDGKPSLCYDPAFVSSRCEEHPIRVIKTVRLRTRQVSQLLNNKGQTLHESTIYLIIVAGNCCRPQSQNYFAPQRPSRCEARLDWKSQQLFLIFLVLRSSRNKRRWCNFGGNFYLHNLIS